MNTHTLGHLARGCLILVLCGIAAAAYGSPPTSAAPVTCSGGTPAANPAPTQATPPSQADAAPIPTEAPVGTEVNPPGDIPDNQAFVTYRSTTGGYVIATPEGWARTESGPNVTFADKLHRFTVEITCADAAPTVNSAKRIDVPSFSREVPAFELVSVQAVSLPAGTGIIIRYRANSAPDDVTGKQIRLDIDRYEVFKDGRLAVISLAGPAGSDNVDVSNQVSRSFAWTA